ncbi:hypothetical protein PZA11_005182 [Diplocarpon coronariae]
MSTWPRYTVSCGSLSAARPVHMKSGQRSMFATPPQALGQPPQFRFASSRSHRPTPQLSSSRFKLGLLIQVLSKYLTDQDLRPPLTICSGHEPSPARDDAGGASAFGAIPLPRESTSRKRKLGDGRLQILAGLFPLRSLAPVAQEDCRSSNIT